MSPAQKYEPDSPCFFRIVKEQPKRASATNGDGAHAMKIQVAGGANRDRTGDLLLAKQALSQLSYGPRRHSPGGSVGGSGWT